MNGWMSPFALVRIPDEIAAARWLQRGSLVQPKLSDARMNRTSVRVFRLRFVSCFFGLACLLFPQVIDPDVPSFQQVPICHLLENAPLFRGRRVLTDGYLDIRRGVALLRTLTCSPDSPLSRDSFAFVLLFPEGDVLARSPEVTKDLTRLYADSKYRPAWFVRVSVAVIGIVEEPPAGVPGQAGAESATPLWKLRALRIYEDPSRRVR